MKNYLVIDTSSAYLTVSAVKDGQYFTSHASDCAMRHSVLLMDEIDKVLKAGNLSVQDFDFFSAVVGAGSFTGIRIGISAMKGFCLATGKPSLPVTSFEVAAYNALDDEKPLCLVNALHGYYYVCGFDENKKQILKPQYITEEQVLKISKEGNYTMYALEKIPLMEKADVKLADSVKGLNLAVEQGAKENKFGELKALYIRKSQAEENLSH